MTNPDPVCSICGSKKSEHSATDLGPYTHPREVAGEGKYVCVARGIMGGGISGEDLPYERWEFRPYGPLPVTESQRRALG